MPDKEGSIDCRECGHFDSDIAVNDEVITWCDELEEVVILEDDGSCTKCPIKSE